MTANELRQIIQQRWKYSYDVQLRKIQSGKAQGKIFLQVMWRFQEQASFPLTEAEYLAHLNKITTYLNEWGVTAQVREALLTTKEKPRLGKVVSVPLDLGGRAVEWFIE
jgi:hypothetical protein